jgi:hypothetical protein
MQHGSCSEAAREANSLSVLNWLKEVENLWRRLDLRFCALQSGDFPTSLYVNPQNPSG